MSLLNLARPSADGSGALPMQPGVDKLLEVMMQGAGAQQPAMEATDGGHVDDHAQCLGDEDDPHDRQQPEQVHLG